MAHIYGIDVSGWERLVNWNKLLQQGFLFALIKASQADGVDSTFKSHWQGAKDAGILHAAYHFYVQDIDPHTQAQVFLNQLQGDPGELPPIVDVELETRWDVDAQQSFTIPIGNHSSYINNLHVLLSDVEAGLNRRPMIYTSSGFWNNEMSINGNFPGWAPNYELWVANFINFPYTEESVLSAEKIQAVISDIERGKYQGHPSMPLSWKQWVFWQVNADTYLMDGVQTFDKEHNVVFAHLDLNVFDGTFEQLRAWAHLDPAVTTTPTENPDNPERPLIPTVSVQPQSTLTNQQMINVFFRAFGVDDYWNVVIRAGLAGMADDRLAQYSGLPIDELPLSDAEKGALKSELPVTEQS